MRTLFIISLFATALLVISGCAQQRAVGDPRQMSMPAQSLAAGDRVQIVVFQQEDLSGEFTLDADGNLAMPLAGSIVAEGLSPNALREAIVARLKPDYLRDPEVTVERISIRPVYLLGEVRQPGSYQHSETLSVAKAVALAGGLTYRASKHRISIRRVDANGEVREFRADMHTPVQGGDLISIPERFF